MRPSPLRDAAERARAVANAPDWWRTLSADDHRDYAEALARDVLALLEAQHRIVAEAARWEKYACDLADQVLALVDEVERVAGERLTSEGSDDGRRS